MDRPEQPDQSLPPGVPRRRGDGPGHAPVSPGEVLREEFMQPLGLTATGLALALRVHATRITDIIREEKPRSITAQTALRLARYFGTSPEFWLALQTGYDLAYEIDVNGPAIEREVQPRTA